MKTRVQMAGRKRREGVSALRASFSVGDLDCEFGLLPGEGVDEYVSFEAEMGVYEGEVWDGMVVEGLERGEISMLDTEGVWEKVCGRRERGGEVATRWAGEVDGRSRWAVMDGMCRETVRGVWDMARG